MIRPHSDFFYLFRGCGYMFHDSDLNEIKIHLERACDQCLLTRRHCKACNVERLLGIIESIEQNGYKPVYLISAEELGVLTSPGSPEYPGMAEKWKDIVNRDRQGPPA